MKLNRLLIPICLIMLLMAVGVNAAFDITWTCPVKTSPGTTSTSVAQDIIYEDDTISQNCQRGDNNFTIEFAVTGLAADWYFDHIEANATTTMNATLFIYQGNTLKHTLPLNSNFTNTSATSTSLVRFVDWGTKSASTGQPLWYQNLTDGTHRWHIELWNNTDTASVDQILSSETGMNSGGKVKFHLDTTDISGVFGAAAAGEEGTEEVQAIMGLDKITKAGKRAAKDPVMIGIILILGYWYWKSKK